jgi:iron(III) transport system ATP-binding protein
MLSVAGLAKTYRSRETGAVCAVDGVSFEVADGTIFGILGPSGCGKSTLLRLIAGLELPDTGAIRIAAEPVFDAAGPLNVPPNRRDVSMVFQSYAVWPHMTVFGNVAFPLEVRGADAATVRREVEAALDSVALADLAARPANTLSGGQQQRLALARAIVARPKVLLLDEPLSNLDAKLRERMRVELKRLQQERGLTTVFVTHDQAEGLSLSDRVAVMENGRFVQVGTAREVYGAPANRRIAEFIGSMNLVPATLRGSDAGGVRVDTPLGSFVLPARRGEPAGGPLSLGFRPENVQLGPGEAAARLSGTVEGVMYYGDYQELFVRVGGELVIAKTAADARIAVGATAELSVEAAHLHIIPGG